MRCVAALSTHPTPAHAAGDVVADLLEREQSPPSLLLVLVSPPLAGAADDLRRTLHAILRPVELIIVVTSGLLAAGNEVTKGPAIALWGLWTESDEELVVSHSADATLAHRAIGSESTQPGHTLVLADPNCAELSRVLARVEELESTRTVSGALLADATTPVVMMDGDGVARSLTLLSFTAAAIEPRIGFGSEALSQRFRAGRVVDSMLCEIDGAPAIERVETVLSTLDAHERSQAALDLAVGVVDPDSGAVHDVVRVLGADRANGALALARSIPQGAICEFHRQDRTTSGTGIIDALGGTVSAGALLFVTDPIDPDVADSGVADLAIVCEALGTAHFAGLHVTSVIGGSSGPARLLPAPLGAAIFRPSHH